MTGLHRCRPLVLLLHCLCAVLLAPHTATAQVAPGTLLIVVIDSADVPITAARVRLLGTGYEALSNADGRAIITGIEPKRYIAEVSALGYDSERFVLEVTSGMTLRGFAVLPRSPIQLEGLEVTATERERRALVENGFYTRRKMGFGDFFTHEQLERTPSHRLSDVLRRIPGLEVVSSGAGAYVFSGRSSSPFQESACVLTVYLNGSPLSGGPLGVEDIDRFAVQDVEAMEVYRGPASTPIQFRKGVCGAVVIWTRVGP